MLPYIGAACVLALILFVWWYIQFREVRASKCGHVTRLQGTLFSGRETREVTMDLDDNGEAEYCLDCLQKMTICCAHCERPIFVGDQVSLRIPEPDAVLPHRAREYFHEVPGADPIRAYVGCVRSDCSPLGAIGAQGYWMPPGEVERFESELEEAMQRIRAGERGAIAVEGR